MSQIKRVAQNTGKSKKVARKGLKSYQKSRKTMLHSIKRRGGWAAGAKKRREPQGESRWYYHLPNNVYAYGPTTGRYKSEKDVREMVRKSWGFDKLPRGTAVWRA